MIEIFAAVGNPIVAKSEGLRPKYGVKGEAVALYCDPLTEMGSES